MKAILVVDIDDSLIEGEDKFAIDGYLMQESDCEGCYEAVGCIKNVPLKPLPPHEKALMFGSEFEMFSEKVGEIVLDAIEENNETDNTKVETD